MRHDRETGAYTLVRNVEIAPTMDVLAAAGEAEQKALLQEMVITEGVEFIELPLDLTQTKFVFDCLRRASVGEFDLRRRVRKQAIQMVYTYDLQTDV